MKEWFEKIEKQKNCEIIWPEFLLQWLFFPGLFFSIQGHSWKTSSLIQIQMTQLYQRQTFFSLFRPTTEVKTHSNINFIFNLISEFNHFLSCTLVWISLNINFNCVSLLIESSKNTEQIRVDLIKILFTYWSLQVFTRR